jgi:hypothetical protein
MKPSNPHPAVLTEQEVKMGVYSKWRQRATAFRAIWYVEDGRCNLVSRRGNVLTRFDALGEQVASARSGSFGAVLREISCTKRLLSSDC